MGRLRKDQPQSETTSNSSLHIIKILSFSWKNMPPCKSRKDKAQTNDFSFRLKIFKSVLLSETSFIRICSESFDQRYFLPFRINRIKIIIYFGNGRFKK